MENDLTNDLGRFASRHGLSRQLHAARVVRLANELAADRFRAVSFRSGRLTLAVPSAITRRLLQRDQPSIITAMNERLGQPLVERIAFHVVPSGTTQ